MMTGRPCGERSMLSAPCTVKYLLQPMEFLGQKAETGVPIIDECAVLPGIPKRLDDFDEFARLGVTLAMRWQAIEPEVARGVIIGRRHHIPGRAPMRDVIQRGKLPREDVRLEKAARRRRPKADMGSRASDRGQPRDWLHQ